MGDSLEITPVDRPVDGTVRPPGSKSLTNRALIVAALAEGPSVLNGVLDSQDTRVMIDSLERLGLAVEHDRAQATVRIEGCAGHPREPEAELWLENSGTSIRFLTALCTLGFGQYRLDGNARMRERPIAELVDTLNRLGARVVCELGNGCPPVLINAAGLPGGTAPVSGRISSQYLSALLMAAPAARDDVTLQLKGELVSEPYVEMTLRVMEAFGGSVDQPDPRTYSCRPHRYEGTSYEIEPDASAASYFFAVAAITGGEVTVQGLSRDALQGDVRFVDVLRDMGCDVVWSPHSVTVRGRPLHGIDIDMNSISDTAQTLAAVAVFATGPTRIRNIAHVRHKETDRIAAVATELRRLGQTVEEHPDGLTIVPAPVHPSVVQTYDDHRMAMSFALVGLKAPGIRIADPECTVKTYPKFFEDLGRLCGRPV
jgi:3-phosphoshikimate 1-carboxyvinyltransferase